MWEKDSDFGNRPYHTEVQWFSQRKVLKDNELSKKICQLVGSKGKDSTVLRYERRCELTFLTNIIMHLSILNLQLWVWDHVNTDMHDAVKVFQVKLHLWEKDMQQ